MLGSLHLMSITRSASVVWEGNLRDGKGRVSLDSSQAGQFPVSWPSRVQEPNGLTSPEELIAAAHASCFSMALSHGLTEAGNAPTRLNTSAHVDYKSGVGITGITLVVRAEVAGLTNDEFVAAAQNAKANCPISKALSTTPITLDAALA